MYNTLIFYNKHKSVVFTNLNKTLYSLVIDLSIKGCTPLIVRLVLFGSYVDRYN